MLCKSLLKTYSVGGKVTKTEIRTQVLLSISESLAKYLNILTLGIFVCINKVVNNCYTADMFRKFTIIIHVNNGKLLFIIYKDIINSRYIDNSKLIIAQLIQLSMSAIIKQYVYSNKLI